MVERFTLTTIRYGAPEWLTLLIVPGVLLLLWAWRLSKRQSDRRRFIRNRRVPVREQVPIFGDLLFWLCLLVALAATIVALARPKAIVSQVRTAGVDLVVLQDGSASMRVKDVQGDRWQRSMRFLRTLGESLRWERDRVALALFASIATPQIRLTRDPNTFFFFLDHLGEEPPFRLQDFGSWDTNMERGITWGLRLVEKDEEIAGRSNNARAFVLLSDGQAWSGEVERAVTMARERRIPLHVIGVGTTAGGVIPEPQLAGARPLPPLSSSLDRRSLSTIATAGGGRYFELDREPDSEIANVIINATRQQAAGGVSEGTEDLYWQVLLAAGGFLFLGVLLQRDRASQVLLLGGTVSVLVMLAWL